MLEIATGIAISTENKTSMCREHG